MVNISTSLMCIFIANSIIRYAYCIYLISLLFFIYVQWHYYIYIMILYPYYVCILYIIIFTLLWFVRLQILLRIICIYIVLCKFFVLQIACALHLPLKEFYYLNDTISLFNIVLYIKYKSLNTFLKHFNYVSGLLQQCFQDYKDRRPVTQSKYFRKVFYF